MNARSPAPAYTEGSTPMLPAAPVAFGGEVLAEVPDADEDALVAGAEPFPPLPLLEFGALADPDILYTAMP